MTDILNPQDYEHQVDLVRKGRSTVSVPRDVAKQFFLRVENHEVEELTGDSILFQKLAVWFINVLAPLTFVGCVSSVIYFHGSWTASLLIPVFGIVWTVIYGFTSDQGGWWIGTVPLVLSLVTINAVPMEYGIPLVLYIGSLWLQRATYLLSDFWIRDVILQSYHAYEMMVEHISFTSR